MTQHHPPEERDVGDSLREAGERIAGNLAFGFALLMHLMVGVFYLWSGLIAPPYAALPLWAVWILLAYLLWRHRRRVGLALSLPFAAAGVWGGVMWLGDTFLGWSA